MLSEEDIATSYVNEQDGLKTIEEIKSQILKQENPRKIIGIDNDR